MTIRPGDFWVADIPFTSGNVSKRRPVLVLWLDSADVMVAAVTTAKPRSEMDVEVLDWRDSGLVRASTVRLSRLDCLEQSLLLSKIGSISATDASRVKSTWQQHIRPQF